MFLVICFGCVLFVILGYNVSSVCEVFCMICVCG